jgi:hypothetical protein
VAASRAAGELRLLNRRSSKKGGSRSPRRQHGHGMGAERRQHAAEYGGDTVGRAAEVGAAQPVGVWRVAQGKRAGRAVRLRWAHSTRVGERAPRRPGLVITRVRALAPSAHDVARERVLAQKHFRLPGPAAVFSKKLN